MGERDKWEFIGGQVPLYAYVYLIALIEESKLMLPTKQDSKIQDLMSKVTLCLCPSQIWTSETNDVH